MTFLRYPRLKKKGGCHQPPNLAEPGPKKAKSRVEQIFTDFLVYPICVIRATCGSLSGTVYKNFAGKIILIACTSLTV